MMTCTWTEDEDGNWHTGCGNLHILIDGDPSENGMRFCCYCGGSLVEAVYTAPVDTEEAP